MGKRLSAAERMQKICRALPDVKSSDHFGSTAYSARGKMFATYGEKNGVCVIVVQVEPEQARALLADPRNQPYARRLDTVMIPADATTDWQLMETLIFQSYRLNVPPPKLVRKTNTAKKPVKKTTQNKPTKKK